ncbi:hypothetical protein K7432_010582 [Basidiobolus ranarum]|uniref:UDENN domain-containing protein n=1 Tax=Basidiobolus ranarum TaxID=34480 RepID=A0ABR2WNG7_9FUNG
MDTRPRSLPVKSSAESIPALTSIQNSSTSTPTYLSSQNRVSWDVVEQLALDRFQQWIIGFCQVNFDLELGQALDFIFPPMKLSETDSKNICFSAFPDTNVFGVGDTVFHFRIRSQLLQENFYNENHEYLYGFVFFRQKKDPLLRRGYFQKSLVLLTVYPFYGLFSRIIALLGPLLYDIGRPMLEAACHNIASWGPPVPGQTFELPFLGTVVQAEIPLVHKPQLLESSSFNMKTMDPENQILASVVHDAMYNQFHEIIGDMWLCWELVLLGEPIVVTSQSPATCSETVTALIDMISPVPYCGDFRPYFTIQDSDFKTYINKNRIPSAVILGVTNPFFDRALEHWPHHLRIGQSRINKKWQTEKTPQRSSQLLSRFYSPSLLEFSQGLTSKRKRVVSRDHKLIKNMALEVAKGARSPHILNNTLRRHFIDLTEKFMVPFNRYFSTLIPVNITLSSSKQPPRLKPFKQDDFMKSLQEHGPQVQFKTTFGNSDWLDFYRQFLKCGNFATWLQWRTAEAQKELQRKYLEVLCDADLNQWMSGKHEVELVDLLLRVKEELKIGDEDVSPADSGESTGSRNCHLTDKQRDKLEKQSDVLVSGLPPDLRATLSL